MMYKFTAHWSRRALVYCVNIAAYASDTLTRGATPWLTAGDRLQGRGSCRGREGNRGDEVQRDEGKRGEGIVGHKVAASRVTVDGSS